MKIEDLKAGRVYRAKRPRVVHTLGGSYINDRQILSIGGGLELCLLLGIIF